MFFKSKDQGEGVCSRMVANIPTRMILQQASSPSHATNILKRDQN